MSKINDALSKITETETTAASEIKKVEVKPIKQLILWPWAVGGLVLTLAVGSWAVMSAGDEVDSHQPISKTNIKAVQVAASHSATNITPATQKSNNEKQSPIDVAKPVLSPTVKATEDATQVYSVKPVKPKTQPSSVKPRVAAKASSTSPVKPTQDIATTEIPRQQVSEQVSSVAKPKSPPPRSTITRPEQGFVIEKVELTPRQIADKEIEEAQKALDENNIKGAVKAYSSALRHVPRDEVVRQKLAALYYGRGDARKASEILQQGMQLNPNGETLRIALAKLLIKEDRAEAALAPLVYLPSEPSTPYLSLRAALAQKNNQDRIALESYQLLVGQDSSNGRWWLGLAIQQERDSDVKGAAQSYQNALAKVGVSKRSQQFIRDRLELLNSLEGGPHAN
ncbi:MSHA biogenesis protein MshN [Vibrio sp. S4M6]|uniref:tetratricopeptide repeat protein n=1 Tax=Vibrio sinus TaxID=2946865 RepID=UPI00202A7A03|nr:tetratricopeptide repeat protein [Vibrio sinus]MCL9780526.1 MSHA biogenesis protein MshN [Vibrio sinus]